MQKKVTLAKLPGFCGMLSPVIAFGCIFSAIAYSPNFSWTNNALSDLGIQEGITASFFNAGLIVGGILALIFAVGLVFFFKEKLTGKIGALLFALDTLALIAIGVFPENVKPNHYIASVAFFAMFPLSMLFIVIAFFQMSKPKKGWFTFLVAVFAAAVWIIQWTIGFGSGVAIPEAFSAFSASIWSIVLGFEMFKRAEHSAEKTANSNIP